MYSRKTIDFYTAANNFSTQQDTLKKTISINPDFNKDTAQQNIQLQTTQKLDFLAIDSILRKSEEREKQIQEQVQAQQLQREAAIQRWLRKQKDTTEILYKEFGIAEFPIKESFENDLTQQNFLYNFLSVKPKEKEKNDLVFIENEPQDESTVKTVTETTSEKRDFIPKENVGRMQFDWITLVLIGSVLLLGWVQLLNKKYLTSLFKATVSFKESISLYREKNSLMEKASFMVNVLFLSTISIFVIQILHFYNVDINSFENYILYIIVLGVFLTFYVFRLFTSTLIGYIFLKQKVFAEFFHNANVYTKIIGLALLPVIISLQFLFYEYLIYLIYIGIAVITIMYLFHVVRSFQIIIRKNVSISYMILYLCAFEFAPFLIMYKITLGLVQ